MKIFISGASGYLGSHLVKSLSLAHQVVALLRSSSSKVRLKNIPIHIVYLDEEGALERAFQEHKPDIIINTATLYGRKGESISALLDANIDFPIKLLALAKKYRCKAFFNTGTSLPDDISYYALTKNTFVKLAKFSTGNTPKFINVVLEHFYGPEDDPSKFTSYVIKKCLMGEDLQLTNGEQRRDFIYIDDVVSAYETVITNISKLEKFENIPLGSGECPTIREFVEAVHACIDTKSNLEFGKVAMRENELMYSCADITRLNQLGWSCAFPLVRGIEYITEHSRIGGSDGFP
jgi:CDP-paratose synthetase